nr:hypothetical protein CFP56_18631 [Quercus suber]
MISLPWRKQHQHQRLLSSDQRSSSLPLEPPRHCSESAPTHPNTTVLSVGSIATIPRKLMYKQVLLPRECIGKQIFFAIQYFNCSG